MADIERHSAERPARGLDTRVRALQAQRLAAAQRRQRAGQNADCPPSRWRHVPLAELFREAGNPVTLRGADKAVCGHRPFHKSSSDTCVVLWLTEGRWWCSSCQESGDAASWVMATQECTYAEAAAYLTRRFDPPHEEQRRRPAWFWRRR
ncbi:MAG TPA: CHC2 zinc finger domain-containing protein [Chloroflexota bacterium]|nr:CHC2 zinc finger domain-containing protein [Chloroflexota bacterium]